MLNLYGQSSSRDFTDTLGELGAGGFRIIVIIVSAVLYFEMVCISTDLYFKVMLYFIRSAVRFVLL